MTHEGRPAADWTPESTPPEERPRFWDGPESEKLADLLSAHEAALTDAVEEEVYHALAEFFRTDEHGEFDADCVMVSVFPCPWGLGSAEEEPAAPALGVRLRIEGRNAGPDIVALIDLDREVRDYVKGARAYDGRGELDSEVLPPMRDLASRLEALAAYLRREIASPLNPPTPPAAPE